VEPGFPKHTEWAERAELVSNFAATMASIVAIIDVEGIFCGGG
jgi:hypothetical protein